MSCNGCRVLRKGCSETCILRSCLQWIDSPEAQGNATLFLAKFFGRSDLLSFISAVAEPQRPALFQSLLFEACGRTVNPVDGAVGLLSSGNWHVCQAAVETVLAGGVLRPIPGICNGVVRPKSEESSASFYVDAYMVKNLQTQSRPSINFRNDGKENQDSEQHLSLSLTPRFGGTNKRSRGMVYQRGNSLSYYNSEGISEMTSLENNVERNRKRVNEEKKLLNLFV